jgi:multiple sugar transport system ATP-binding protein
LSPCAPEVADFSGRVVVVERLGPTSLVHVELAHGAQVIAIAGGSTTTQAGMEIGLRMEPDSCHIFGQDGQRIETGGKDTLAH